MADLSLTRGRFSEPHSSPLAFVIGSGRCGSTLLARIIGQHEEFGFLSRFDEHFPALMATRWPNRLFRSLGEAPRSLRPPARYLQLRMQPSEGWTLLARHVSPEFTVPSRDLVADNTNTDLVRRLRRFFDPLAVRRGNPSFFQKFTGWPRATLLHEAFPSAVFVHVVRDGRSVSESLVGMPWWSGHNGLDGWAFGHIPPADRRVWEDSQRSPFLLAGIQWKLSVDAALDARRVMPASQWCDVRYEDLVDHPEETLDRIFHTVGARVPSDYGPLLRSFPIRAASTHRNPVMPRADAVALMTLLAPTLEAYGYPL